MAEKLLAPRLGEGVTELFVSDWLKNEGDMVEEMEPVVEVETDKVATELPSPAAGVILKIMAAKGNTVQVGEVMAYIGEPGESLENLSRPEVVEADESKENDENEQKEEAPAEMVSEMEKPATRLSPLVKKIAAQHSIDLNDVKGTGAGGRITKDDVLSFLDKNARVEKPEQDTKVNKLVEEPVDKEKRYIKQGSGKLVPHSSMRRRIADNMVKAIQSTPHVLTVMEADLTSVLSHKKVNQAAFAEKGIRLTLTAYFIAAIVEALKAYPMANSSWTEEGILVHDSINLGMAVALGENGLIVPVIKNAASLSLMGIVQQVNDLAQRARAKKLAVDEVKDVTFSLTNHGSGGSLFATPIINEPQSGILGTGVLQKRPVVISDAQGNDAIAIRPMIYLSYVFDHRVLDGEGADKFLSIVKEKLEHWQIG